MAHLKRTPLKRKAPLRARTEKPVKRPRRKAKAPASTVYVVALADFEQGAAAGYVPAHAEHRPVPKPAGPWRSPDYLAFVRSKPCAWCNAPAPSEASHHGKHGIGTKAGDHRCIPLCSMCHRGEYHRTGALGRMTPEQTREWAMDRALETVGEWVAR